MKKEKIHTVTDQNNQIWEGIDHDSLEKEAVDYCPGCNVAYCHGRYTTGQCE
jgi:hypothetical protein